MTGEIRTGRLDEGGWLLELVGEHDLTTSARIRDEIDRIIDTGTRVLVDLSETQFIDASVIGVLVHGQQRAAADSDKGFALVVTPGSFVERVLVLVGAAIPTVTTRETAEAELNSACGQAS